MHIQGLIENKTQLNRELKRILRKAKENFNH
nr:MAG TPA: hypothetical protein [Caudoviricetes sp.]